MLRKKRKTKKPTKMFEKSNSQEESKQNTNNRFQGIYDEDLVEIENENKNEGENMIGEKIDSKQQFEIDNSDSYDLIAFKLEEKHFFGLESESDVQAIKVSKEFYDAFKKEFNK
jgi:hypothetical protein